MVETNGAGLGSIIVVNTAFSNEKSPMKKKIKVDRSDDLRTQKGVALLGGGSRRLFGRFGSQL